MIPVFESDFPQALPFDQWAATLGTRNDACISGLVSAGIDLDITQSIPN